MKGFADIHNHQFSYLGFGGMAFHGRAWGPLDEALPWCDFDRRVHPPLPIHGPGGAGDIVGNIMKSMYGGGLIGHRVGGYPEFDGWPRWDSVTHQSMHEEWLYRALQGGLRLIVVLAVNNEFLCGLVNRRLSCNDMEAVDRQLAEASVMQDHIDEKAGGPGKGWYRIVRSPREARAVMADGKLAVVLGIEVDYLFNCRADDTLSADEIRAEISHYYDLGVRHIFPIHFSDNGFGGTAWQNSLQWTAGWNWIHRVYFVATEDARDDGYEFRGGLRNVRGLSPSGRTLIQEMIARGIMVDVDHMSARTKSDVLDICEAVNYPVIAGHAGFVETCRGDKRHEGQLLAREIERIRRLGGMIAPIVHQGDLHQIGSWDGPGGSSVPHVCGNSSNTFAQAYLYAVSRMGGAPVAIGTDLNGFAGLPGPRFGGEACSGGTGWPRPAHPLGYPFTASATGGAMGPSVVGNKTFDYNVDGLAHVGLLPDFIADLEAQGVTPADLDPLMHSAEGYVRVWERCTRMQTPVPWCELLLLDS